MRKIICLFISTALCMLLSSCEISDLNDETDNLQSVGESFSSEEKKKFDRSKDYAKYREELELHASNVIAAFMDHDKESLANEFCEKTREICDLSAEIDAVFEWLGSEVLSYGEVWSDFKAQTFGGGTISRLTGFSYIYDVITEKESYTIILQCVPIYDDDETEVGLQRIMIHTSDWDASNDDSSKRMEIGELLGSWDN